MHNLWLFLPYGSITIIARRLFNDGHNQIQKQMDNVVNDEFENVIELNIGGDDDSTTVQVQQTPEDEIGDTISVSNVSDLERVMNSYATEAAQQYRIAVGERFFTFYKYWQDSVSWCLKIDVALFRGHPLSSVGYPPKCPVDIETDLCTTERLHAECKVGMQHYFDTLHSISVPHKLVSKLL